MNKLIIIFCLFFISACSSKVTQLITPNEINYNGKNYILAGSQDLGEMARYVYLTPTENLQNWSSQIEILLDRNTILRPLKQRIELRKRIYKNQGIAYFNLSLNKSNELQSRVIYAPSEQEKSWQINVAKGKELNHCGFVQFQISQKIDANISRLNKNTILKMIQKTLLPKEIKNVEKYPFNWQCLMN